MRGISGGARSLSGCRSVPGVCTPGKSATGEGNRRKGKEMKDKGREGKARKKKGKQGKAMKVEV